MRYSTNFRLEDQQNCQSTSNDAENDIAQLLLTNDTLQSRSKKWRNNRCSPLFTEDAALLLLCYSFLKHPSTHVYNTFIYILFIITIYIKKM